MGVILANGREKDWRLCEFALNQAGDAIVMVGGVLR
jgi:hypothetical protein